MSFWGLFDRVRFQCKENETNIMFSVALLWGQLQAFSKFPRGKLTTSPRTNFSSNLCLSHWHCRVNPRVPGVYINTRNRRHFPLSVIRASRELVLSPGRLLFGSHNNELIADIPPSPHLIHAQSERGSTSLHRATSSKMEHFLSLDGLTLTYMTGKYSIMIPVNQPGTIKTV